jgi:hypothetical protein
MVIICRFWADGQRNLTVLAPKLAVTRDTKYPDARLFIAGRFSLKPTQANREVGIGSLRRCPERISVFWWDREPVDRLIEQ